MKYRDLIVSMAQGKFRSKFPIIANYNYKSHMGHLVVYKRKLKDKAFSGG